MRIKIPFSFEFNFFILNSFKLENLKKVVAKIKFMLELLQLQSFFAVINFRDNLS